MSVKEIITHDEFRSDIVRMELLKHRLTAVEVIETHGEGGTENTSENCMTSEGVSGKCKKTMKNIGVKRAWTLIRAHICS